MGLVADMVIDLVVELNVELGGDRLFFVEHLHHISLAVEQLLAQTVSALKCGCL